MLINSWKQKNKIKCNVQFSRAECHDVSHMIACAQTIMPTKFDEFERHIRLTCVLQTILYIFKHYLLSNCSRKITIKGTMNLFLLKSTQNKQKFVQYVSIYIQIVRDMGVL